MMESATVFTSSLLLASLTPPPLPRPPAWTWALTTTGKPNSSAILATSSEVSASLPRGVGTSYFLNNSFAWYSWIFMGQWGKRLPRRARGAKCIISRAENGARAASGRRKIHSVFLKGKAHGQYLY